MAIISETLKGELEMSKKVSGHRPAGGPAGKNVRKVAVRTGSANHAVNPGYAAQLGAHVGNREGIEKIGNGKAISPPLGNELAGRVKQGPGGSRDVHKSGYQN